MTVLVKPAGEDSRVIGFFLGRIFLVVAAAAAALPAVAAVVVREWHPLGSFLLMIGVFSLLGVFGIRLKPRVRRLDWSHGMAVVALTWLVVPAIGAIPFMLSGHFADPLDAYFDAMSGLSTTGLSTIQDLDHLAGSLNLWRHLLHFLGGQGIILAVLVLFASGGGLTLYYGEARDEQILPSVGSTARFIWTVSVVHLVAGVFALSLVALVVLGFSPVTGEVVGDYGVRRDGWTWTQLNDDQYAQRSLLESGLVAGANRGIGIRMRHDLADALAAPGGYRTRGPVVTVTGVWMYHDPGRGGESYLEVTSLVVTDAGRSLEEPVGAIPYIAGLLLLAAAAALYPRRSRAD